MPSGLFQTDDLHSGGLAVWSDPTLPPWIGYFPPASGALARQETGWTEPVEERRRFAIFLASVTRDYDR
jgi:hypothetical protein